MQINNDLLKNATLNANQITYGNSNVNSTLNNLPNIYQIKSSNNHNAWSGKVNKLTLPVTYYGYYIIISMTPYNDYSMYLLFVNGTALNKGKIFGGTDSTFVIDGNELTVTLSNSGYWNTFALYLGSVY